MDDGRILRTDTGYVFNILLFSVFAFLHLFLLGSRYIFLRRNKILKNKIQPTQF